jgi:hypothetical protein
MRPQKEAISCSSYSGSRSLSLNGLPLLGKTVFFRHEKRFSVSPVTLVVFLPE